MIKKHFIFALAVMLIVMQFGTANEPTTVPDEGTSAQLARTLKQLTKEAFAAGEKMDLDTMFSYFCEDTVCLEHGKIDDSWEQHKKNGVETMARFKEVRYPIERLEVDVLSPDAAVVYGIYSFTVTAKSGQSFSGRQAWSWVYKKVNGTWKIKHVHVSAPPRTTGHRR